MLLFSNKAIQLLLAVGVSIWMAGGCLFGCANTTMCAEVSHENHKSVAAVPSCHAKQPLTSMPSFVPGPRGLMSECPLVVNATAAISKNSTHVSDSTRGAITALPSFEKQIEYTDNTVVAPFLPNRGPTHLRCCVFLI